MHRLLTTLFLCATLGVMAQLRLPSVISSGMVVQQNAKTSLFGWGNPGAKVLIQASWSEKTDTAKISNLATWKIKIDTPPAGGPHSISLTSGNEKIILNDILSGEVWLCSGQSNMEWSYRQGLKDIRDELPVSYNRSIRLFHIPKTGSDVKSDDVQASWKICDSVSLKDFSAVGYFFGKQLQQSLNVPVGLLDASWGGTPAEVWVPEELIDKNPVLKEAAQRLGTFDWWPSLPGKAYNAMIAPIHGHQIAGAIWYQGESNVGTYSTYQDLMKTLIESWRAKWNHTFPFYLVQIAPFEYDPKLSAARLREAQDHLQSHPATGMVVVSDLVDNIKDIHPVNKHDVGLRLANLALGDHYKVASVNYRSPAFLKMERNGSKLVLHFSNANALMLRGKEVLGFLITGPDKKWLPAKVRIEGSRLVIWNASIKNPEHVRYAFDNTTIGNIFSETGLPLAPFRTDRWEQ